MLLYLRDRSALTIVRAATLRQKLRIKLSTSPSHNILTPDRPVPVLTLYRQAPGRVATGGQRGGEKKEEKEDVDGGDNDEAKNGDKKDVGDEKGSDEDDENGCRNDNEERDSSSSTFDVMVALTRSSLQ